MYASVAPRPQLYEGTTSLNPPGYSASKAALAAFTRYTASFWGRDGVRANCISPGPFSNTEDIGTGQNAVQEDSPFVQKLKGYTVLNRIGRPRRALSARSSSSPPTPAPTSPARTSTSTAAGPPSDLIYRPSSRSGDLLLLAHVS